MSWWLSTVVMQELAAGARTPAQLRELERLVFQPFVRRGRVFAPMTAAFVRSGRLLAAVAAREGWPTVHENPSLLNDALHVITMPVAHEQANTGQVLPLVKHFSWSDSCRAALGAIRRAPRYCV